MTRTLRPLAIDDAARQQAARVLAHAAANHYRPGPGVAVPGDDPRFVAVLSTYRCCFTYTHSDGGIWRQLSVSVPSEKYPNMAAVCMLAELFGFTGWNRRNDLLPEDWSFDIRKEEHCVMVAQAIGSDRSN